MFRAVVSATPNGYMVELRVGRDRLAWAVSIGHTVDKAMRVAVKTAGEELALQEVVLRKKVQARILRRAKK